MDNTKVGSQYCFCRLGRVYCKLDKKEPRRMNAVTAQEAIKFIHEKVWQGSKPGLDRTRALLSKLGDPHKSLRFIHLAGTNGKGSTAAMLSNILRCAGLKTGLYTSPFISCFNERMQIDGQSIPDDALGEITEECLHPALAMEDRPTEFELVTAIAMKYFCRERCEVVVLETGMGGRLDSTNVIEKPLCSVITNIGLDHTRELGDTAEKIAAEKAGIIKQGCPTVIYELPESVKNVIKNRCEEVSSELVSADFSAISSLYDSPKGQRFSYKNYSDLSLPLLGEHQLKNAAVALEVVSLLRRLGVAISEDAVHRGLEETSWPGRFEIVNENPCFVVDGGHNPQCAETVADNLLRYFPNKKRIILFGVLADKDYTAMAAALNKAADCFVTIAPPSPRALGAEELAKSIEGLNKPVYPCGSVEQGIEKALEVAGQDAVVCSVGSLYSAGRVREYFGK